MSRQRGFDIGEAAVYTKEGKELSKAEKDSLTCALCYLLLRDPHQVIQCGHRFCRGCVEIVFVGRYICKLIENYFECNKHVRGDFPGEPPGRLP